MNNKPSERPYSEDSVDPRAIAIVGMSCRLPGAPDLPAFWSQLQAGFDALVDLPASRPGLQGYTSSVPATPGRSISRQGGFLSDIDAFDPWFFGISRRDAICMDPQQRILLELAWSALEDAGIPAASLRGTKTGVYVGVCYNDFNDIQIQTPGTFDLYRMIGGARSMLCGRISHALGLAGPSLSLDAACASSLVAVHLAVQSLRSGESSMALVAAVNLLLHPVVSVGFSQARMLAPDSRCKAFSHAANGLVRSDGAGLVVLKPLAAALRDGDRVYAILHGSAVGNDGVGEAPLMSPSPLGQELVLRAAYADAGLDPASVSYVEAHGTGTPVGDPVEAQALGTVLSAGRQTTCRIGSVKSNIGHTEAAAGLASLIKTALCLHHRTLVPSLHCETPNPGIPWEQLRLQVQRVTEPWHTELRTRIAGVSSFGLNGTNAHVVLSEAPHRRLPDAGVAERAPSSQLLTLSAHSPQALRALVEAHQLQLASGTGPVTPDELVHYCAAAALRRTPLHHRLSAVVSSSDDAHEKLGAFLGGATLPWVAQGQVAAGPLPLVFLYSGQGSNWTGMGRSLYARSAVFRDTLHRCDTEIARYTERSVVELVMSAPLTELPGIDLIQPLTFAMQVALTAVFFELGVIPDRVLGHSMGEVAAAHIAGALDLPSACRVICTRSRLLRSKVGQGAMAVVELPLGATEEFLRRAGVSQQVSIAVSNSAASTVIAGEPTAVRGLVAELTRREVFTRLLNFDVASHCPQMDELREPLLAALSGITAGPLRIPMLSTVTGQRLQGPELGPEYWATNLRQPVLLAPRLDELLRAGECSFVECSAHPLLLSAVQQCQQEHGRTLLPLPAMRKPEDDWSVLLATVGALHTRGHRVRLERLFSQSAAAMAQSSTTLPAYPFQRELCVDEQAATVLRTNERESWGRTDPCLGARLELALGPTTQLWTLDSRHSVLLGFAEHAVHKESVVPGAATVCWALTAAQRSGRSDVAVEDVTLSQLLFLPAGSDVKVQLVMTAEPNDGSRLHVYAATEGSAANGFTLHSQALLRPARLASSPHYLNLSLLRRQQRTRVERETIYQRLVQRGLEHGPSYQLLLHAEVGPGDALGALKPERGATADWAHGLSPALLDNCLQLLVVAASGVGAAAARATGGGLPVRIDAVRVCGDLARAQVVYAKARPAASPSSQGLPARWSGDIWLLTEDGEVLLELVGVTAQELRPKIPALPEWHLAWRPQPLATTPAQEGRGVGYVLVLGDAAGLGSALANRLRSAGQRCVTVGRGAAFARLSNDHFTVSVTSPSDWGLLQRILSVSAIGPCLGAIYLLGLEAGESEEPEPAAYALALEHGCLGLTTWLQANLEQAGTKSPLGDVGLLVVTRKARAVLAKERTRPLQALLWGFTGVVGSEHPELRVRRLDLDQDEASVEHLHRELVSAHGEDAVAWRAGRRFVLRLAEGLPEGPVQVPPASVRGDATYLVTGGLTGLGLGTAEWLAEHGATRLVLLGRSAPLPATAQAIAQLEKRGVEVVVAQADVTDEAQLSRVLAKTAQASHPLRGIFHSAVVIDDGALLGLRPESLHRVVAPKVLGALHLHRLTATQELDYFVSYSSAASALSNPGQSSYCAANAFLESLAESRVAQGQPALSIGWGSWAKIGRAAMWAELQQRLAARGLPSLSPEEGWAALARLLESGSTSCCPIVTGFDVETWLQATNGARATLLDELRHRTPASERAAQPTNKDAAAQAVAAPKLRDALRALPESERLGRLVDWLRELVGHIVRAAPSQRGQLAMDRPLTLLGLDSLMAVELRNRIDAELGVRVPLSLVLQSGTMASIAAHVLRELPPPDPPPAAAALFEEGEL